MLFSEKLTASLRNRLGNGLGRFVISISNQREEKLSSVVVDIVVVLDP